jgi:protein-tyrosine phosphatase
VTRRLRWPHCLNVRDLGGLPTTDGGATRAGALIRSDNLDRLTATGVAAVRAAGVTRIVDVRSAWECRHFPSPFADDPSWRNSPVSDDDGPDLSDQPLAAQYTASLDLYPHRIATAVGEIADAPAGCALVCCHAGKDRTGIVVALVLALVGVEPAAIADDYASVGDGATSMSALIGAYSPTKPELQAPTPTTMLTMLDHLQERYGGAAAYLAQSGLTARQAELLTARIRDR